MERLSLNYVGCSDGSESRSSSTESPNGSEEVNIEESRFSVKKFVRG